MERKEAQLRRKQWRKLEIQSKKERDDRVLHEAPTAKITKDVEDIASKEKELFEVQAFRERSLAIIEQKNNDSIEKAVNSALLYSLVHIYIIVCIRWALYMYHMYLSTYVYTLLSVVCVCI